MNQNPELQRQCWLECSQARLIGAPAILASIFTLCYLIDDHRLGPATAKTALTLFGLITLLWGTRQTMDSILEEYREKTWDTQRLSALGPWPMTWGKLLGSTSMVWYCAGICLVTHALAVDDRSALPLLYFYAIGMGLLVQSAGLLLGQLAAQRGDYKSGSILALALLGFLIVLPGWLDLSRLPTALPAVAESIAWYSLALNAQSVHQFSLVAGLGWCLLGNQRLMAQELGVRKLPLAWLGLTLFLIIYLGGFIPASSYSFSLAAFIVCGALTYLGTVVDRHDAMRWKRLIRYWQQADWQRVGEETPLAVLSFLTLLPFALLLSLGKQPYPGLSETLHLYPAAIALLIARDCMVYVYLYQGKNPQRAFGLTLLFAVLCYGVLPGLFGAIGLSGLAAAIFPLWADSAAIALVIAALQCGLIAYGLYRRWQLTL